MIFLKELKEMLQMIDEVIWWDILDSGALFSIKFIWSFFQVIRHLADAPIHTSSKGEQF